MDDIEIEAKIKRMPHIKTSIVELFDSASQCNRAAYVLAIQNSCLIKGIDKYYQDSITNMMTQSFSDFYGHFKDYRCDNDNINIMAQMLLYSLFWENAAVLRLLNSLVDIIEKGTYSIPAFLDTDHQTYNCLMHVIGVSGKKNLAIEKVISSLYYNQIRNATVHAQILFYGNGISLGNFDKDKIDSIRSISMAIWEQLYSSTCTLIEDLFYIRRSEVGRL